MEFNFDNIYILLLCLHTLTLISNDSFRILIKIKYFELYIWSNFSAIHLYLNLASSLRRGKSLAMCQTRGSDEKSFGCERRSKRINSLPLLLKRSLVGGTLRSTQKTSRQKNGMRYENVLSGSALDGRCRSVFVHLSILSR